MIIGYIIKTPKCCRVCPRRTCATLVATPWGSQCKTQDSDRSAPCQHTVELKPLCSNYTKSYQHSWRAVEQFQAIPSSLWIIEAQFPLKHQLNLIISLQVALRSLFFFLDSLTCASHSTDSLASYVTSSIDCLYAAWSLRGPSVWKETQVNPNNLRRVFCGTRSTTSANEDVFLLPCISSCSSFNYSFINRLSMLGLRFVLLAAEVTFQ